MNNPPAVPAEVSISETIAGLLGRAAMPSAVIAFNGQTSPAAEDGKIKTVTALFLLPDIVLGNKDYPGLLQNLFHRQFQRRDGEELPDLPGGSERIETGISKGQPPPAEVFNPVGK